MSSSQQQPRRTSKTNVLELLFQDLSSWRHVPRPKPEPVFSNKQGPFSGKISTSRSQPLGHPSNFHPSIFSLPGFLSNSFQSARSIETGLSLSDVSQKKLKSPFPSGCLQFEVPLQSTVSTEYDEEMNEKQLSSKKETIHDILNECERMLNISPYSSVEYNPPQNDKKFQMTPIFRVKQSVLKRLMTLSVILHQNPPNFGKENITSFFMTKAIQYAKNMRLCIQNGLPSNFDECFSYQIRTPIMQCTRTINGMVQVRNSTTTLMDLNAVECIICMSIWESPITKSHRRLCGFSHGNCSSIFHADCLVKWSEQKMNIERKHTKWGEYHCPVCNVKFGRNDIRMVSIDYHHHHH